MALSYSAIRGFHTPASAQAVDYIGPAHGIIKEHKSVHTRPHRLVNSGDVMRQNLDNNEMMLHDNILKVPRGVDRMATVQYRTKDSAMTRYPRTVMSEGAFQFPEVAPTDTAPLSRQPHMRTSANAPGPGIDTGDRVNPVGKYDSALNTRISRTCVSIAPTKVVKLSPSIKEPFVITKGTRDTLITSVQLNKSARADLAPVHNIPIDKIIQEIETHAIHSGYSFPKDVSRDNIATHTLERKAPHAYAVAQPSGTKTDVRPDMVRTRDAKIYAENITPNPSANVHMQTPIEHVISHDAKTTAFVDMQQAPRSDYNLDRPDHVSGTVHTRDAFGVDVSGYNTSVVGSVRPEALADLDLNREHVEMHTGTSHMSSRHVPINGVPERETLRETAHVSPAQSFGSHTFSVERPEHIPDLKSNAPYAERYSTRVMPNAGHVEHGPIDLERSVPMASADSGYTPIGVARVNYENPVELTRVRETAHVSPAQSFGSHTFSVERPEHIPDLKSNAPYAERYSTRVMPNAGHVEHGSIDLERSVPMASADSRYTPIGVARVNYENPVELTRVRDTHSVEAPHSVRTTGRVDYDNPVDLDSIRDAHDVHVNPSYNTGHGIAPEHMRELDRNVPVHSQPSGTSTRRGAFEPIFDLSNIERTSHTKAHNVSSGTNTIGSNRDVDRTVNLRPTLQVHEEVNVAPSIPALTRADRSNKYTTRKQSMLRNMQNTP